MPRKPKAQPAALPAIPAELLEQFGNGPMTAEAINAATLALKKALIERALGGEMNHHLGYPPGAAKPANATNQRNGKGAKTILTEDGPIRIEVPRDRDGSFEPILIPKHERRFTGFDDKIVAMYARGMTVREIQGFLLEQYGTEVSPDFISSVTGEVSEMPLRMNDSIKLLHRPVESTARKRRSKTRIECPLALNQSTVGKRFV